VRKPLAACLIVAATGCASEGPRIAAVQYAAAEFDCRRDDVVVVRSNPGETPYSANTLDLDACGHSARYVCTWERAALDYRCFHVVAGPLDEERR
jgi:hypothetical protein